MTSSPEHRPMEPSQEPAAREPLRTPEPEAPVRSPSGRPFGCTAGGSALVHDEASAIRDAAQRVLAGETLSSIVKDWNQSGLTTAKGGPWRVNSLSNLLVQTRLVDSPPIITEEMHVRFVELHASRRKGPRRATRRYLFTGML